MTFIKLSSLYYSTVVTIINPPRSSTNFATVVHIISVASAPSQIPHFCIAVQSVYTAFTPLPDPLLTLAQ